MKSFFLLTLLTIAVAIACSPYKSAGSPTLQNNNAATTLASPQNENVPAQDKPKCALTVASVPDLNGLKPGMTTDEVLALFPGSREDAEVRASLSRPPSPFGVSNLLIRPDKYQSKEKFVGINQITFSLLDGRVSNLNVGYNGPEYSHVDKFVARFTEGTNLPAADAWEAYVGMDTQMKTLTCKDFEVRIYAGGKGGSLNYILVKDLVAENTLKDRRKKARENASPTP